MKRRPEEELLNDLFGGSEDLRSASLERTLSSVRQRRRVRQAVRLGGVAAILLGFAWLTTQRTPVRESKPQIVAVSPSLPLAENIEKVPGTDIRVLNDEELLAMFPERPVAIIGADEERQFVFLDREDSSDQGSLRAR